MVKRRGLLFIVAVDLAALLFGGNSSAGDGKLKISSPSGITTVEIEEPGEERKWALLEKGKDLVVQGTGPGYVIFKLRRLDREGEKRKGDPLFVVTRDKRYVSTNPVAAQEALSATAVGGSWKVHKVVNLEFEIPKGAHAFSVTAENGCFAVRVNAASSFFDVWKPAKVVDTEELSKPGVHIETLLILPVEGRDVPQEAIEKAGQRMELELKSSGKYRVLSSKDIRGIEEAGKDADRLDCQNSAQCLARLGQKLAGDLLLACEVKNMGEGFFINAALVDVKRADIAARATRTAGGAAEIEAAVAEAVKEIFGGMEGKAVIHMNRKLMKATPRFAVMDLRAQGVEQSISESLTDVITVEIGLIEGAKVFSRKDIAAMLTYEGVKQQMQHCDDVSCFVEIGGALGVDYLVTGSAGRLEETYIVNVQLIDISAVEVVGTEMEKFRGPADGLLVGMRFLVRRLFEIPYTGEGRIRLAVDQSEATVSLDGEAAGRTPVLNLPDKISSGKHILFVEKDGYYSSAREAYVEPAQICSVDVRLVKVPVPWYKTWWFWTLAGSAAAGAAVTTSYLLAKPGASPESGDVHVKVTKPQGW